MLKYVLKRVLMVIPVMIGVSIIVFALMRVFSPDPAPIVLGQHATQEQMDAWREGNGLERAGRAAVPDLRARTPSKVTSARRTTRTRPSPRRSALASRRRSSWRSPRSPSRRSSASPSGVIAAVKKNSIFDAGGTLIALIGVSIPIFWLGILFIMFFSGYLHLLPSGGRINVMLEPTHVTGFYMIDALLEGNWAAFQDAAIHIILPALTLGMYSMAIITRMTRSSMLETLGQDYVRTARAKGLTEGKVIGKHALRNSLIPVITVIGLQFGALLGGALLTESVFSWPGIGKFTVDSHHEVGLPGRAGHRAARRRRVRHREPRGGPHLRVPRPAHQVLVEEGRVAA